MKPASSLLVVLLLSSLVAAEHPFANWNRQFTKKSPTGYQKRAGSTRNHSNGDRSRTAFRSGLVAETGTEAGFTAGKSKKRGYQWGRDRDEKWFLGVRTGGRIGYAADAEASRTRKIGKTDVTGYVRGETFVGAEAGAQAGVTNNGAGIGAGGFVGARAKAKAGTRVGPVDAGVTGEAWAGAGAEANVDAKFKNRKLTIDAGAGAALGVGGRAGGEVTVDLNKPIKSAQRSSKRALRGAKKTSSNIKKSTSKARRSVKKSSSKTKSKVSKWFK